MWLKTFMKEVFQKNKRQKLTLLSALFVLYALEFAGVFSYFNGSDVVTNRFNAKHGSVTIQEPLWNSNGESMAKASEPGMHIPKNPSGVNNGQINLYIRIKMTVKLEQYSGNLTGTDQSEGDVGIPSDEKRLKSIVNAIKLDNGENFITLNTEGNIKDWKIEKCNNANFTYETDNKSDEHNELAFCFYYTAGDTNGNDSVMHTVYPENTTAELFQYLEIPIYKKDYLGVFDQKYYILLQAEGIPAQSFKNAPTIEEYKKENNE